MTETIKTASFTATLEKTLNTYNQETQKKVKEIAEQIAKEAVEKLKQLSRAGVWGRKAGKSKVGGNKYANGWRVKVEPAGIFAFSFTVYNTNGQLTHLLENPHALRGGGSWTPKEKHIKPVEEWCQEEFEKRVEKELGS